MNTAPATRPAIIPLTLISGFPKAGKSTLLDALRTTQACAGALILHRAGDTPRFFSDDPSLTLDVMSTPNGCLCCSGRGDWTRLLERLLRERDNRRIAAFDRLLVETSGEADPATMLAALSSHPYLSLRFAPAGILTVVDAATVDETIAGCPEARRQVALANWIVINPAHGPDSPGLRARLAMIAPAARLLTLQDAAGAYCAEYIAARS